VSSPLSHCARVLDAGRPKQHALAALGARHDAVQAEDVAGAPIDGLHGVQIVILGEAIEDPAAAHLEAEVGEVARAARYVEHDAP
jgi:hypothetical protein